MFSIQSWNIRSVAELQKQWICTFDIIMETNNYKVTYQITPSTTFFIPSRLYLTSHRLLIVQIKPRSRDSIGRHTEMFFFFSFAFESERMNQELKMVIQLNTPELTKLKTIESYKSLS